MRSDIRGVAVLVGACVVGLAQRSGGAAMPTYMKLGPPQGGRALVMLPRLAALLAVALLVGFSGGSLSAQGSPIESFAFDLYDPSDDGDVGPVSGSEALQQGRLHAVVVSGIFSGWNIETWEHSGVCPAGAAEGSPPNDVDAEYMFARPSPCNPEDYPLYTGHLELSLDDGLMWNHVEPAESGYRPDHVYTYTVVGQGYPLQLRYIDNPTSDNYGSLNVEIYQAVVGGIAEYPDVGRGLADSHDAPSDGSSLPTYALVTVLVAGAVVTLTAGAWYARRRWLG